MDYDAGETYFRLIISVDSGSDSLEVTAAITVSPVNEHPPLFNIPDVHVLSEDVVVGTTISSLMATDLDAAPHAIVEYQLASGTCNMLYLAHSFKTISLHGYLSYYIVQFTPVFTLTCE